MSAERLAGASDAPTAQMPPSGHGLDAGVDEVRAAAERAEHAARRAEQAAAGQGAAQSPPPHVLIQMTEPPRASRAPIGTLVAWVAVGIVVLGAIGTGTYLLGSSSGDDLDAARAVGNRQGQVIGERSGRRVGRAQGADRAYRAGYRSAYRRAYRSVYEETTGQ
jgi:hypothetical protein